MSVCSWVLRWQLRPHGAAHAKKARDCSALAVRPPKDTPRARAESELPDATTGNAHRS